MDTIIKKIIRTVPYPYIDEKGNAHDGLNKPIPTICKKCNYLCFETNMNEKQIDICPKGFNFYTANFKTHNITLFGLLVKGYLPKLPRKKKKELNETHYSVEQIQKWEQNTRELIDSIIEFKDRKIKDNFSLFHDIIPTISIIFRTVESIINSVDGDSFEEKVENADNKIKTLYHSIDLLDNRLKIMPLLSNPDSVKYGQVTKCSPYKVFDKVRRLFFETASRKGVRLNLDSNEYINIEPMVYDSFMILPFLLIENAIKYSLKNHHVDILFTKKKNSVLVTVSSFGPIVQELNVSKIFEQGFKDPNAQKFSSKGSGIGLFLANIVAKAHNFDIIYSNQKGEIDENGIEMGINEFSITLNN